LKQALGFGIEGLISRVDTRASEVSLEAQTRLSEAKTEIEEANKKFEAKLEEIKHQREMALVSAKTTELVGNELTDLAKRLTAFTKAIS